MDFPTDYKRIIFGGLLEQGFAFRLKGDSPFVSDKYHIFVVLNYNPKTGTVLLLVNETSQVEKCERILKRFGINVEETTVKMQPGDYSFITKETLFDCNTVHEVNIGQISFLNDNVKFLSEKLSDEDIKRLVDATKASPRVKKIYKDML